LLTELISWQFVTEEPLSARTRSACARQLSSCVARDSSPSVLTSVYEPTGVQYESSSDVEEDKEGSRGDAARKSNGSINENRVSPLSAERDESFQLDVGAVTASSPTDRILFTERDVSAIHGLLELGVSTTSTDPASTLETVPSLITPDSITANRDLGQTNNNDDTYSTTQPRTCTETSPARRSEATSLDSVPGSYITPNCRLELLRHYRYQVAPWVSPIPILEASPFQRKNPWSIKQTAKLIAGRPSLNTPPLAFTEAAILTLLQALQSLVSDDSQT
jgi:hypothetical protein